MLSKEEIEKAYWEGYIAKQNEAIEICKQCKYMKKVKQLESDKQNLIKKLEEDIVNANDNIKHMEEKNILQTIARELAIGMRDYAQEILEIVKGAEE